jgi:hypothetical protein
MLPTLVLPNHTTKILVCFDHPSVSDGFHFGVSEYADPSDYTDPFDASRAKSMVEEASPMAKLLNSTRYPLEQRIEDKRRRIGRQKYPFIGRFSFPSKVKPLELYSLGSYGHHDWSVHQRTGCKFSGSGNTGFL